MNKCSPHALGVAMGVLWAAGVFFCGITAMFGWGKALVNVLASCYLGYSASPVGALIGAAWAVVDGYVGGAVLAFIYNRVNRAAR
jgi:hypothetical protein